MGTFDLALGLGPVGVGEFEDGVAESFGEQHRPVADAVVGEDTFDDNAVRGVERVGSLPQRGGGGTLLVVQALGVVQSGVVIDRGVQQRVADGRGRLLVHPPSGVPVGAPPPPSGIRPSFFTSMWTRSPADTVDCGKRR